MAAYNGFGSKLEDLSDDRPPPPDDVEGGIDAGGMPAGPVNHFPRIPGACGPAR